MDEAAARARIESMIAASSEPTLTAADIDDLVEQAKRADPFGNLPVNVVTAPVWVASTSYAYGDVVTAAPAAGRWWRVAVPGVTGSTQPTWPTLTGAATYVIVSDGTVQWEDIGGLWAPTWDLNYAAMKGWELKADLAAEDFEFGTDGQLFRRQQVIDHCERRAKSYRRCVVGSAVQAPC